MGIELYISNKKFLKKEIYILLRHNLHSSSTTNKTENVNQITGKFRGNLELH